MPTIERPAGPAAELSLLTGGDGVALVAIRPFDLDAAGYVEEEYAAAGTATSYAAVGDLPAEGTFVLEPVLTADYRTRIVVRRPTDAAAFNGTVVVEWLNVSGGVDASPDWAYTAEEILRGGYAWATASRRSTRSSPSGRGRRSAPGRPPWGPPGARRARPTWV